MLDSKEVLWQSVSALMAKHYGRENLGRLAKECGFAATTAFRMREQKTSVGVDIVDKIAQHFGLAPWELLVPGFNPDSRPTLQPLSEAERRLYEKFAAMAKELKEAL